MKYDVFISYRREDSSGKPNVANARQIKQALEGHPYHYKVFFDYSECTDEYFSEKILPAIRTCDFFLLVLTKDSLLRCMNEGDWVRREIEEAIVSGVKIIPVTPDNECDSFPSELPDLIKVKFKNLQITNIHTDALFDYSIKFLVENRFHNVGSKNPVCPEGALPGRFSVSLAKQVYFSRGNLQYHIPTDTWRFADCQFHFIGEGNERKLLKIRGWIDLFGWGTGDCPSKCTAYSEYFQRYAYEKYAHFVEWGKNKISNGVSKPDFWRTLTKDEWEYLLMTRNTVSGIRYAKAEVKGVAGLILLPDDWDGSIYSFYFPDTKDVGFGANTFESWQWAALEKGGAAFLPAAGCRRGTSYHFKDCSIGYYWSSSFLDSGSAHELCFYSGNILPHDYFSRYYGFSVRLVCPAE